MSRNIPNVFREDITLISNSKLLGYFATTGYYVLNTEKGQVKLLSEKLSWGASNLIWLLPAKTTTSLDMFGNLPSISPFISESRRKHISCGQVFIRRDGNCSQRKVFPVAKENVLWPLTGLVFAGYNALTGSLPRKVDRRFFGSNLI